MPAPLKKSDRTRLRLVAAVREAVEDGDAFTAERIARRAGSSPATFYNHFKSQDEAFDTAFAALMDELVAMVDEGLRIERVLDLGLSTFAAGWILECVRFFRANSVLFRTAQARSLGSASINDAYESSEARAIARCARFIRHGQAAGLFRRDDADRIAQAMMVTAEGYNNPAVLRMRPGDCLHRELTRALVHLLAQEEAEESR